MPCKVFGPNRTKMFHVKHFGTIQTAGYERRLVGLPGSRKRPGVRIRLWLGWAQGVLPEVPQPHEGLARSGDRNEHGP
jgi:hypothetical protein